MQRITKAELESQLLEARKADARLQGKVEKLEGVVASLESGQDEQPDLTEDLKRARAAIRGAVAMSGRNGVRRWQRDHAPTIKAAHE